MLTGSFSSDDNEIGNELRKLNIGAAQFFTNAVNTTSKGVDAILAYSTMINGAHNLKFSFAGNFNDMVIDQINTNQKLKGKENIYFSNRGQHFLLASAPKSKLNFGIDYAKS